MVNLAKVMQSSTPRKAEMPVHDYVHPVSRPRRGKRAEEASIPVRYGRVRVPRALIAARRRQAWEAARRQAMNLAEIRLMAEERETLATTPDVAEVNGLVENHFTGARAPCPFEGDGHEEAFLAELAEGHGGFMPVEMFHHRLANTRPPEARTEGLKLTSRRTYRRYGEPLPPRPYSHFL